MDKQQPNHFKNPFDSQTQEQRYDKNFTYAQRRQRNYKEQQHLNIKNPEYNPQHRQRRKYEKRERGPRNQKRPLNQHERQETYQRGQRRDRRNDERQYQGPRMHLNQGMDSNNKNRHRNQMIKQKSIGLDPNELKHSEEQGFTIVQEVQSLQKQQQQPQYPQQVIYQRGHGRGRGRGRRERGDRNFQNILNPNSQENQHQKYQNRAHRNYQDRGQKRVNNHEHRGRGGNRHRGSYRQNNPNQHHHSILHQGQVPVDHLNLQFQKLEVNPDNLDFQNQSSQLRQHQNLQRNHGRQKISKEQSQAKQKQRSEIRQKRRLQRQERDKLNQQQRQQKQLLRNQRKIQREQYQLQKQQSRIQSQNNQNIINPNGKSQSFKQPKPRQRREQRQFKQDNHHNRRGNQNDKIRQPRGYGKEKIEAEKQINQKEENKKVEYKKEETQKEEDEIPSFLVCPISQVLMIDPVLVTVCGHTFQSSVIREWVKKKASCPLCNKAIEDPGKMLMKNFALSDAILHYKK